MNHIAIFLLIIAPFATLQSQKSKRQIHLLQKENDSLRQELQKCQTGFFQRLTESLESPKFGENPKYSRAELHAKLLPQIKLRSEEKHAQALSIIASTDRFITYCGALKAALIQRTGGLNTTGQPLGARDNKASTQFFIEEKHGDEFKTKIEGLRSTFLNTIQNDPFFSPRIVILIETVPLETKAKSWAEYKFMGIPLNAVFPIIGKYESDAPGLEAAVLQYLNE